MSFRNYYDSSSSSYGRSRDSALTASNASKEKPTSVTAKYINNSHTPTYKSSSIPILNQERADRKDEHEKTPISTIQNRYANYNKSEKPASKYEKKDYTKLTAPSNKSRDVSPVSTVSKYSSLNRSSRHLSPDRRSGKTFKEKLRDPSPGERDKDIPSKTDKSLGYNSLSNYKLYPKTSNYIRPTTRLETKPEISVNRYAIANRLNSTNYLRNTTTTTNKKPSVSPININHDSFKIDTTKPVTPTIIIENPNKSQTNTHGQKYENLKVNGVQDEDDSETEIISIVTRHTSPTPPGSSSYVRSRRADMAKTIEKTITRFKKKPEMVDKEIQSDRLDDPTRSSRFGSTARTSMTNWSYYSPSSSNYTGYAGRYSTQYSSFRENPSNLSCHDRSSRSRSKEPISKESASPNSFSEYNLENNISNNKNVEPKHFTDNNDDNNSDIVINVNLKLSRTKSPTTTPELVSPEITITSSQLPPQAPKTEGLVKTKKQKVRKSSTDSSTDSSTKKKVVKKRSKSASSTESDVGNESTEKTSTSGSKNLQKTSSNSNLQNGYSKLKHSKSRDGNSPESSISLSTQSSISEDETISKSKTQDMSRTTTDEISIPTDRSARQASPALSHKSEGTEEAKSFLIRALAPVANLFKNRHQDSTENTRWPDSSTSESTNKDVSNLTTDSEKSSKSKNNIVATNDDGAVTLKSIRPIESESKATWPHSNADSNLTESNSNKSSSEKNMAKKIRHVESGERAWWLESSSDSKKQNHKTSNSESDSTGHQLYKHHQFMDDEKPWWLDSSANIPEGIERLTPPRKSASDNEKSDKFNFFKVRPNESGEKKEWWLTSNENSSDSNKVESHSLSKSGSERNFPLKRIRHVESGERPWWLSSTKNIPEGIEKLPTPPPQDSESSDEEVEVYMPQSQVPPFPLHLPNDEPLGDRRSPEGLETPNDHEAYRNRSSPYENDRQYPRRNPAYSQDRYISRYADMDDVGMSRSFYSPYLDSPFSRRTGQALDEDECKEIDPTQVKIHDSTAQRPVIKKIRSRSNIIDCTDEDQLQDVALQVYKDGEYGSYMDLDLTQAEQEELIEGLNGIGDAVIVRTKLALRARAIIRRLKTFQGRELRNMLLCLQQQMEMDKDLVHEFIVNKGIDCLMDIADVSNYVYLDYILVTLGRVMTYIDGMNGVIAHKECIKWLYSLLRKNNIHILKTTLKLLLVFVDYSPQNCTMLIDSIIEVDKGENTIPWHNIMQLLNNYQLNDSKLLIFITTLINTSLNSLTSIDMYYDQIDALQDQGIHEIFYQYTVKNISDFELLKQIHIFESVLKYHDRVDSQALKKLDKSITALALRRDAVRNQSNDQRTSKKLHAKGLKQPLQNGSYALTGIQLDAELQREPSLNTEQSFKVIPTCPRCGCTLNMMAENRGAVAENTPTIPDTTGIVSKAKEELRKTQSKDLIKAPIDTPPRSPDKIPDCVREWEEIEKRCRNRKLKLPDMDFTDLSEDEEPDDSTPEETPSTETKTKSNIPVPPPPPPPPPSIPPVAPLPPPTALTNNIDNGKKTIKLRWNEIKDIPKHNTTGSIWDELPKVPLDTGMVDSLFISKTNDIIQKENLMEKKQTQVLGMTRSNAINIALTKLPPPTAIKSAIIKMDLSVIGREGVEKLLSLLPTEEEITKINKAQSSDLSLPLGSAESFLLTLSTIHNLQSRLRLGQFKLEFENNEKDIAEPLMDLKTGIEKLKENQTFKIILSTIRTLGVHLNGRPVKGFQLDYLKSLTEVKDTVHRHTLLHHVCGIIIDNFPDSTDFFSEIGPFIRASKIEFDTISLNLTKLENECKELWLVLKELSEYESAQFEAEFSEFLTQASERIIILKKIEKKVMMRFEKMLLYFGVPKSEAKTAKPSKYLPLIAEFALDYRTMRERVLRLLKQKAEREQRMQTRGKNTSEGRNHSSNKKHQYAADDMLMELLTKTSISDCQSLGRKKSSVIPDNVLAFNERMAEDKNMNREPKRRTSASAGGSRK